MSLPSNTQGNRPFNRHTNNNPQIRKNERIRAREVRLISPEGKMIGIMTRDEALGIARQYGLDLVEISPNAQPPVCRVLDYGKYMYEVSKREKEKHHVTKVKILKFRSRIEQHDYLVKLRHGEEFLYKGNKLKITLQFRGREVEHKDIGIEVVQRAVADLLHVGVLEGEIKTQGRVIHASMNPLPQAKRKLKYNEKLSETDELKDDSDEDDEDEKN